MKMPEVNIPLAPMFARKTVTVQVRVPDVRLVSLRLRLSVPLFRLAALVGGFKGVRMSMDS